MISRVYRGTKVHGLLTYLFGEGRRNEHTDAHLIASWDGDPAALEPVVTGGRCQIGQLAKLLDQPVRVCERAPEQHVYHLVLRNAPEDRVLSDAEWGQVCTAAMDRTGIAPADDPAGCRWVAVRHADDHIHLVATLAREDGRAPHVWRDYIALNEVRHDFEARFGLRSTAGRDDRTANKRAGVKETVTAERYGRRTPPRVTLRQRVSAAAAATGDFAQFTDVLAQVGVTVWPRMSEVNPDQVTGYSVSLNDYSNGHGEPVRFGGGKLAPDLSLPKLHARWGIMPTGDRPGDGPAVTGRHAAPDPTHQPQPHASGLLNGPEVEQAWREAERIVREAADHIGATASQDPDAAADTAWAAADALHGFAAGVEGPAGGPLTEAADDFARAGRQAMRQIPARTDNGAALRSAGRMIAVLAAGNRNAAAQMAAVSIGMTALVAAVADLRRAQNRLHQVQAAAAAEGPLRAYAASQTAPSATPAPSESAPTQRPTAAQIAARSVPRTAAKVQPWRTPTQGGRRNDLADRGRGQRPDALGQKGPTAS